MTRGLLRSLGDSLPNGTILEPVRVVRTVGEPLLPGDVAAARRILPKEAILQFEFGMNEAGVLAARAIGDAELESDGAVTVVGPLLDGVDLRIVDPDGDEVPTGESGEIIVRGANVAIEYRNEPELNAARFRVVDGEREFSTGDLGRMRADGSLEFLGRNDARLKIRNFTIEPAEVEAALLSLPEIAEAGVTSAPDAKGSPMLVAYLVPAGDARLRSPAIRAQLAARVPSHFVPSVFYAVPMIAKTRTGKIDRAELRRVAAEALVVRPPYEAPVDIRERTLQQIVSEILKVDAVGRNDDIFELGADSLDLLELFTALHERFDVDLPDQLLLEAPTIALLAERIAAGEAGAGDDDGAVLLSEPGEGPAFFCVTGVGSYAFRLRPLARELWSRERRPVYALKSFGPGRSELNDVDARAERLVAGMRSVQPHGPYFVGGHSAGGVVAYEIARRLRAEGETVELVAFLDTLLPRSLGGRVRVLRDRARRRWKGAGLHDRLRRAKYVTYHLTIPVVRRRRVRRSLKAAGAATDLPPRYRLRPYDGHVLYVGAADREAGRIHDAERIEDVEILRDVVSGPISVVVVPGGHASYIDPANAGAVADAVAAAMHGPITPD
jgi:acyl carrier protein